jgi:hypothetical protein
VSKAFDRSMDELARVWDASDKFDSKVLQFIGIVSAGALAAAAIVAKSASALQVSAIVVVLAGVGAVALAVFISMALDSAIGAKFQGPLNPRQIADSPEYLKNDGRFEADLLNALATAFEASLAAQEAKAKRFEQSLWAFRVALVSLGLATTLCLVSPTANGGPKMPENQPTAPATQPAPAIQPDSTPAQPDTTAPLEPYTITRGAPGVQRPEVPVKPR